MTFTATLPANVPLPEEQWLPARVRRHGSSLEVSADAADAAPELGSAESLKASALTMRVFVDTNVWLDVLLNRSGFAEASGFLMRCAMRGDELWTAWHTIANVDYILARSKLTPAQREQHLRDLLQHSRVSPTDETDALHALNLGWKDFEDALQVAAALRCQADVIVTGNTKHFTGSTIPVVTAAEFLAAYP